MQLMPLWIVILFIGGFTCVRYGDLEELGVSCRPRDTCKTSDEDSEKRNCACDRLCLSYGDCCVDGPKPPRRNPPKRLEGIECVSNLPFRGVYAIATCSSSWNGPPDVKQKCENEDDMSDLSMSAISTNIESKKTYKSLYCAMCNDVSPTQVSLWSLSVHCKSLTEIQSRHKNISDQYIMDNIVHVGKSWGIYHWDDSRGRSSFFPCEVGFIMPQSVEPHVRLCRPNLVSTCASYWTREVGRQACESYMAVIYINRQGYRNAHCAICNDVPLDNYKCKPDGFEIELGKLNFVKILEYVPKKNQPNCTPEEFYHTMFKKCRRLYCGSGYTAKNHKCVKD